MTISVTAIAYKTAKRGPMNPVNQAQISLTHGVENDVFGKPGKRQVTVMSLEQWQTACQELNCELDWLTRRANILISGYHFSAADVGKSITIGDVVLTITGETDPCKKMEIAYTGLEKALTPEWRGGVTCRVVEPGVINTGDKLSIG